jgi:macrolide-specific efflux system membrane fusion protein
MRWKIVAIVVLLAVTGGAIAFSLGAFKGANAASTTFLTAVATTTDVTDQVTATGTVASADIYALPFGSKPTDTPASSASSSSSSSNSSSSSSGGSGISVTWPVTAVNVKVGDVVTPGEALATASSSDLEAQIADAVRTVGIANLQLSQAHDDYANASGTQALRQTKVALYNAQSAKAKADKALADLKALRPYAALVAPAAGIVTAVNVQAGVDAPSGIAITVASSSLLVTTSVVESDVTSISLGQTASITISAINATLQGTVQSIAPAGSASNGSNGVVSYAVEIALDAPPPALRPGMTADVSIVTATASGVIAIPSRALSGSAGDYTVRVVAADGTVTTRTVTVGLITSSLAEIKSGLQAGERVVTGTSSTQLTNQNGGRGFFGGGAGAGTIVSGR